jgi:hypothetical protein
VPSVLQPKQKSIASHRPFDTSELQTRERNLMLLQEPVKDTNFPLERSPLKMPSTKSNYSVFQSPVPHLICCKQNTAVLYWLKIYCIIIKDCKMLAYLISRKHVPTKGVLCILELGLMQKEFFDTAHFLIACRISFSRWRLLFAIGHGRSGLPLPTLLP